MTINVTKYRLNPDRIFAGTRGSYGMEKLSFDFGDGWDFDTISVTFHPQRGKPIKVPILPGTEIDIPAEVMEHSGESRFVVSGRAVGEDGTIERQAITLEGYVDVAYTADEKGGNTRKVTPDMYDQLIDQASKIFDEAREDVERTAAEAAESASDAEGFANSAEENAEAAKAAEEQALKYKGDAETASKEAQSAANEANTSAESASTAAVAAGENAAAALQFAESAAESQRNAAESATAAELIRESVANTAENIENIVQETLQQAKDSGEFDGADGYSPTAKAERVENGVRVTITNKDGTTSEVVQDGESGVHVGSDTPPAGKRVWVNPDGKRTKIPQVDESLTKPGYAADAKAVGEKVNQLSGEIAEQLTVTGKIVLCDQSDFNKDAIPGINDSMITERHSPRIDISGEYPVEVWVKSYKWTLEEQPANHSLYVAQYDGDGARLSRGVLIMKPVREDGEYIDDGATSDMSVVGSEGSYYYGCKNEIVPVEGAKYAVVFNLRDGADAVIEISTYGKFSRFEHLNGRIDNIESALGERLNGTESVLNDIVERVEANKMTMLFDSDTDEWEHVSTDLNGNITNDNSVYASPMIDALGYDSVTVRVNDYNDNGNEFVNHNIWICQYDNDKKPIAGTRALFKLHPILANGSVYEHYEHHSLKPIQDKSIVFVDENGVGVRYELGGQNTVELVDGARYFLIFNLRDGATVDMEIFGVNEGDTYKYVVRKEALPEMECVGTSELLLAYPELDGCADYVRPLAVNVAKAAKAHMGENDLCLVLFTDTHYREGSTFNASKIAKHLARLTNATAILHLGDLIDAVNDGKSVWLDLWQDNTALLSGYVPYLQAVGNHDDGTLYNQRQGDLSADNYITPTYMFNASTQNARRYITLGSKKGWYYMDDEDSKSRVIIVNAHDYPWGVDTDGNLVYDNSTYKGYSPEQLEWLANVAFDFAQKTDGNEWTAIVCGHGVWSNWANVQHILTNAKNGVKITSLPNADQYGVYDYSNIVVTADYSAVHPKQVIVLRGDDHMDALNTQRDFPIVTFLNASLAKDQTNAPVKTPGTPTETCVSVLVFNNDTGTMREVRFGAGSSDPLTEYDDYRVIEYGAGYVKG